MLFEPKPKERPEDLYNFEEEVEKIVKELHDPLTRLIVIKGLRRTGKSSLLRVALNLAGLNYVLLDMREFSDVDRTTLLYSLSEALSKIAKNKRKILLDSIKAVSFMGMKIELKRGGAEDPALKYKTLLRAINEWAAKNKTFFVIAIDEAQEIAKINLDTYLAFIYDNLPNIKIVLAGSQVGVLENILENPKKPLFGRARIEIETKYLSRKESIEFLKKGFEEAGVELDEKEIEKAVNKLNGVAGWLTLFGWYIVKGFTVEEALEKVVEAGSAIAHQEIQKFLETRGTGRRRYIEVLKIIAESPKRWKEIKTLLEIRLKRKIANNQISKYLNELKKYGFITKKQNKYQISDPMLKQAITTKL